MSSHHTHAELTTEFSYSSAVFSHFCYIRDLFTRHRFPDEFLQEVENAIPRASALTANLIRRLPFLRGFGIGVGAFEHVLIGF